MFDVEKSGIKNLRTDTFSKPLFTNQRFPYLMRRWCHWSNAIYPHCCLPKLYADEYVIPQKSKRSSSTVSSLHLTRPEIAAVGLSEQDALSQGLKIKIGKRCHVLSLEEQTRQWIWWLCKSYHRSKRSHSSVQALCAPHARWDDPWTALAIKLKATAEQIAPWSTPSPLSLKDKNMPVLMWIKLQYELKTSMRCVLISLKK